MENSDVSLRDHGKVTRLFDELRLRYFHGASSVFCSFWVIGVRICATPGASRTVSMNCTCEFCLLNRLDLVDLILRHGSDISHFLGAARHNCTVSCTLLTAAPVESRRFSALLGAALHLVHLDCFLHHLDWRISSLHALNDANHRFDVLHLGAQHGLLNFLRRRAGSCSEGGTKIVSCLHSPLLLPVLWLLLVLAPLLHLLLLTSVHDRNISVWP